MPMEDGFVKACSQATHHVMPSGTAIVGGARLLARPTQMAVVDITTMSVAVIPILEALVRSQGNCVACGSNRRCGSSMSTATVILSALAVRLLLILRCRGGLLL
jgi:hypothetical protein